MCEAHAFIVKDGEEKKLLESVDELQVEGDQIRMVNIFGEQKILKARIKSYNSTERKIVLEAVK
ncbi:MAG: CooT family nickel-binding protein [Deltaproteobacteria bacterium]|nr:CooT family nickel-binding protein [Deltaproteobacteria bacterium]MBW1935594.1 CooT family nickel-binding protein [Deltaproteobacteria bacterium]MBW1978846.1 CooT family nickel-binding protein [Deltaproteobacteria bacterium]MBW2044655.1 CooT family nickel-binding protein [Deltaproteobacteria bacterium]MBW2300831.1 CooT family nickel-binding protein [Deltaproteobacteria bacterium]